MTELWIATGNEKKRRELERMLAPLGYRLRMQSEAGRNIEVVEDRPDFAGNAALKATTLALAVGGYAIGDDSGLCVAALDGRPGVLSARYAGPGATDADRIAKLLAELAGVTSDRRQAHFACAICLAAPDGRPMATFTGHCDGVLLEAPRGSGGFGYDPVFVANASLHPGGPRLASAPTFAQLDAVAKDEMSHRGQALRSLAAWLSAHPLRNLTEKI